MSFPYPLVPCQADCIIKDLPTVASHYCTQLHLYVSTKLHWLNNIVSHVWSFTFEDIGMSFEGVILFNFLRSYRLQINFIEELEASLKQF